MSKLWKLLVLVISHLSVAALALYAGVMAANWYVKEDYRQGQLAAGGWRLLAWYAIFSEVQRQRGDQTRYRDSLLEFATALEANRNSGDPPISATMYHTSQMLNHTRLSRLESESGNRRSAGRHMDLAIAECERLNWNDCTTETIIEFSVRADELTKLPDGG